MEIKVREVSGSHEKSQQEVENELLQKHEEKLEATQPEETIVEKVEVSTPKQVEQETVIEEKVEEPVERELTEEDVLSHINKRYNKEISSVDDLFAEKETAPELPEDVSAYLKYRQETGRGFDDYVKLNKDYNSLNPEVLLKEYLANTEEGLDDEDINDLLEEYKYDEEFDEPAQVKKTKLARKKKIAEAKKYFKKQKEYYKEPLESSSASIPESELEKIKAYEQSMQDAKRTQDENEKKRHWFSKKTDEVFGSTFKGFEFTLDDKQVTYSPGEAAELKKAQSSPFNFINKYMGEDGLVKDAAGYHKALAVAMNPDKFAKFFYEQGKSHATEDVMRKTKNINMSERRAPEVATKGGMKIRSLGQSDSGRGLKIKSLKRK